MYLTFCVFQEVDCYLLDNNGYVILSDRLNEAIIIINNKYKVIFWIFYFICILNEAKIAANYWQPFQQILLKFHSCLKLNLFCKAS